MNRRSSFLITLIFLTALGVLNWSLATRPAYLKGIVTAELDKLLKVHHEHGIPEIGARSVTIPGLIIYTDEKGASTFLSCDKIVAEIDFWQLLQGKIEIDTLRIEGATLHIRWNEQGQLSFPSIFRASETGAGRTSEPNVIIRGMLVLCENAPFWEEESVKIRNVDLSLRPSFANRAYPYYMEGQIRDQLYGDFQIEASFGSAPLTATIAREDFRLTDEQVKQLEPALRDQLRPIKMHDGSIDLTVSFDAEDVLDQVDYVVIADLKDVELSYSNWPFGANRMQGRVSIRDERVSAEQLDFVAMDANVTVSEFMVDFSGDETSLVLGAKIERLLLDENLANDFKRVAYPMPDVGESLLALGAEGQVDVGLRIELDPLAPRKSPDEEARVKLDVKVDFDEVKLEYRGFEDDEGHREGYPYPLDKLVGTVQISNDGLSFDELYSKADDLDFEASGWVSYGREPLGFNVDIKGRNIRLDERVRKALPETERAIYDSYHPQGPVDFDLKIDKPKAPKDKPKLEIEPTVDLLVTLDGCEASSDLFPYPLNDVRGEIVFGRKEGMQIKWITARKDRARFDVKGTLNHSSADEDPIYDLSIDVEDLAVDDDLLTGLSREFPDIAAEIRKYSFEGDVDFTCRISTAGGGSSNTYSAELKGLSFNHSAFPTAACTNLVGHLEARDDILEIERASFELEGSKVMATGWVDIDGASDREDERDGGYELFLNCPSLRIDADTLRIAEEAAPVVKDIRELIDVSGDVTLGLELRDNEETMVVTTSLTAQGVRVELKEPSLVFEDVYGSLSVDESTLSFEGWTAALPYDDEPDGDRLVINVNRGDWRRVGGDRLNVHKIGFRDLILDERLFRRMPEDWADVLRSWKLDGSLSGRITSFIYRDETASFHGEVHPHDLTLDPGVRIGLDNGRIMIEDAVANAEGFDLKGSLEDADVELLTFPVTRASMLFQVDHRSVAVRELQGNCLGGKVNPQETFFVMDHGIDGHFESSISITEADLSEWMRSRGRDPEVVAGKATAWASMKGLADSRATYKGEGEMWLSGTKLYELPLIANVLEFLNLDFLASDDPLEQGELEENRKLSKEQIAHFNVRIADEKIHIDNARFVGPGVRLRGDGYIGFDGIVNLEFSPRIIKMLDRVPVVGELVHLATGFVVSSIKITGPLEDLRADGDNYITEMIPDDVDTGRRLNPRIVEPEPQR